MMDMALTLVVCSIVLHGITVTPLLNWRAARQAARTHKMKRDFLEITGAYYESIAYRVGLSLSASALADDTDADAQENIYASQLCHIVSGSRNR